MSDKTEKKQKLRKNKTGFFKKKGKVGRYPLD